MLRLKVETSKCYDITITDDASEFEKQLTAVIRDQIKAEKIAVITDGTVDGIYGEEFLSGVATRKFTVAAGEKSKNGENYLRLINCLAENGFQRGDAVIAFGGGVVGDLAGFVASTYMRGIKLVSAPTTLLAAVDSSVGGKTAIDLPAGKNLCGTFYQPHAVCINIDFFKTLPPREIMNGQGEIIKYALLDGRIGIKDVKNIGEKLVFDCLSIKKEIVEKDEFEGGLRKLLNLGHTVGHAIEKLSGYSLSHGECVVKGLKAAADISAKLYGLTADVYEEMFAIISSCGHDLSLLYRPKDIAACIAADKKSTGDKVDFVALRGVGNPEIVRLNIKDFEKLLA